MTHWPASHFSPSAKSPVGRRPRASSWLPRSRSTTSSGSQAASIETADELTFDRASASLRARRRRRLGALVLAEQTLAVPQDAAAALALAGGVLSLGLARLPWTKALKQRRDRVMFLAQAEGEAWPDLSDDVWPPIPAGLRRSFSARRSPMTSAPTTWQTRSTLCCPGIWRGASLTRRRPIFRRRPGPQAPIDYEAEGGPSIALRVQELFGLSEHPAIGRRAYSTHPSLALARPPSDPDHARSAGLLARLLGRCPL